jgi:hypothetical protein
MAWHKAQAAARVASAPVLLREEAETIQYRGRAWFVAGQRAGAIDKFDAAIEVYHSRGAGTRFVDFVMADKIRAGSKSTKQK